MQKILFVCSGNVFRSLSAEYCLEQYLQKNKIKNWCVTSAGITAKPQLIHPQTRLTLAHLGITDVRHRQHKLNKKMLLNAHVVIGMAQNHLAFMKKNFKFTKTQLFNQVALGKNKSIWDIEDIVKDYRTNPIAVNKQIEKTIRQIHKNISRFYTNLKKIDFD